MTLLASALAVIASLVAAGLLYQQQRRLDAALQVAGVSVILDEDGAPLWLVEADFDAERVRVTALRPPSVDGSRDYQLWQVLPDGAGVSAVTLLPEDEGDSRTAAVPGLAERFDAFAVSLEPAGGASGSVPSGEVLYRAEVFCTDGETP